MAKRTATKTAARNLAVVPETVEVETTEAPMWASNPPATVSVDITIHDIVAQCPTDDKFIFTPETVYVPLAARGLVEINPNLKNEFGWCATRPTKKGKMEAMQTNSESAVSEYRPAYDNVSVNEEDVIVSDSDDGFAIEDDIAPPVTDGRSGKRTAPKYPFDKLKPGQSFFVPNTPDKPEMAKALASTVSAATARYDEVVPGKTRTNRKGVTVPETVRTRKFVIRQVDGGARIWRTM